MQIVDVDNEFSTARVIKDGGNASLIRRGDKIRAVSSAEAKDLIKRKELAASRPRGSMDESSLNASDVDGQDGIGRRQRNDDYRQTTLERRQTRGLENNSTDPEEVVPTYGLADGETRSRIQLHKNLQRAGKTRNVYNRYVELVRTHSGDYLAAYQAGMTARALGMKNMRSEAAEWFDRALSINPDYKPAQDGRAKTR